MKKNLLIGALLLGAASFSMLTGFDNTLTAQDILAKSQEAGKALNEVSADADINLDVDIAVPANDMSLGIQADGKEEIAAKMDPFGMQADMNMTVSLMGQNMVVDVSIYGIMEDDNTFSVYTKTAMEGEEAPQWTKTSTDGAQITQALEQAKNMTFDLSSLPFAFEVAPEATDVNGTECYVLSATATWNDLYLLAQPYLEQLPQEVPMDELDSYSQLLSGLKFNMQTCVDTETFRPMAVHLDVNGSDWTTIAALVSSLFGTDENGNAYEVSMDVKAADIDIVYDYTTPVEIVLPEEAASAQEADPSTLLDMVENADDAA